MSYPSNEQPVVNKQAAKDLHGAVTNGDMAMLKYYFENYYSEASIDAAINASNQFGIPLLSVAAMYGHKDIAELLLNHGADVNVASQYGTPLHFAARYGYKEVAELLLNKDADIDTASQHGTPLDLAVSSGHQEVVELLMHRGAKTGATDSQVATTFNIARAHRTTETIKSLAPEKKPSSVQEIHLSKPAFFTPSNGSNLTLLAQGKQNPEPAKSTPQEQLNSGEESLIDKVIDGLMTGLCIALCAGLLVTHPHITIVATVIASALVGGIFLSSDNEAQAKADDDIEMQNMAASLKP